MNRRHVIGMLKDWGLALVIVLGVLVVWNLAGRAGLSIPTGSPAPDFVLDDLAGNDVALSDSRGEVVVLNFWATWCGPCRTEIPALSEFQRQNPDVTLYGISVDAMDPEQLDVAARRLGIDYTVLHDPTSGVGDAYGVSGLPTTVVVGPEGTIRAVHMGPISRGGLERLVAGY